MVGDVEAFGELRVDEQADLHDGRFLPLGRPRSLARRLSIAAPAAMIGRGDAEGRT
jgi:hypothetical protein